MKKFLLFALLLICSCDNRDTTAEQTPQAAQSLDKETVFSFDINNLQPGCNSSSEIVCTINTAVKCIINPEFSECDDNKENMPGFVFMQDETLQRPTFQSYKITKLVPRTDGAVEVYTQSSCNGNWFGLCNGNIIYVLKMQDNSWIVKDLYAIES